MSDVREIILGRPAFEPMTQSAQHRRPKAPFLYKALLDVVREHPNSPAKIAVFDKGTRKETWGKVNYHRQKIRRWLDANAPCEHWILSIRTVPDTWCDRELWAMYVGEWTLEEAEADRVRRREVFETRMGIHQQREAQRAAKRHMAALMDRR